MEIKKDIYTKLFDIQGLAVKKDATNPFFKSKYMTLDKINEVLTPLLIKNELLLLHYIDDDKAITKVVDIRSKNFVISSFPLIETGDPQKYGSQITYARRYNTSALFNIVTDEDNDANGYNKKTVINYEKKLNDIKNNLENVKSLDELRKVWSTIPPEFRRSFNQLKDSLKTKYDN